MSNIEDRILSFVMKYYEAGRFDAARAYERFCGLTGMETLKTGRASTLASGGKRMLAGLFSAAAAVAVLAVGLAVHYYHWTEYRAIDVAQTFILRDSTSVVLAPGAVLRMQPARDSRLVHIDGKVYFEVHRDESAPFRVDAGPGLVKVLGTEFQVERNENAVSVDVVGGKVLFSRAGGKGSSRSGRAVPDFGRQVVLTAGMSAVLRNDSEGPEIVRRRCPNPASWASGRFVYDDVPLSEVIEELSEYFGKNLNVASGEGWQWKRITAVLSADDREEILSAISSAVDVSIIAE